MTDVTARWGGPVAYPDAIGTVKGDVFTPELNWGVCTRRDGSTERIKVTFTEREATTWGLSMESGDSFSCKWPDPPHKIRRQTISKVYRVGGVVVGIAYGDKDEWGPW